MKKFLPYQQYEIRAIEQWLNKQSMAGYRLKRMDGVFPTFKPYIDHLYHYRVRYIPYGSPKGHSHYWGKLYIYESQEKGKLPGPNFTKDSQTAAAERGKPYFALALLVALVAVLKALLDSFGTASPLFMAAAVVAALGEAAWLGAIAWDWKRGSDIAKGKVNMNEYVPNTTPKKLMVISSVVSIASMLLLALVSEGIL